MAKRRVRKHEASKEYKKDHPKYVTVTCSHCGKSLFVKKAAAAHCPTCSGVTEL
jgi:predicted nucleic-acid-binding Zn-ribbon protein